MTLGTDLSVCTSHSCQILIVFNPCLQFSGNNDEIVDIKFLDDTERYAVVATNSMYIKVFELSTWDCEILYGHTDIVLSLDVFTVGNIFVSSGKVGLIILHCVLTLTEGRERVGVPGIVRYCTDTPT